MGVVKLTSSKKAVQFITDEGEVYQTSAVFLQGLLMGKSKQGFILLNRMPFNVSSERFAKSPLYDPDGIYKGNAEKTVERAKNVTTTNDPFSVKTREKNSEKKAFVDKKVW